MSMIRVRLAHLGIPRLEISARSTKPAIVARRRVLVERLVEDGQVDVLRALADGRLSIVTLDDYARAHPLTGAGLLSLVRGFVPLRHAVDDTLPAMGRSEATRSRYRLSLDKLITLRPALTVRGLASLDWSALRPLFHSPADWNHLRRAVSRFATVYYGGKHQPARHAILAAIGPLEHEAHRVPDLTPALFRTIVSKVRPDLRPAFVALAATGLRVGEYLRLTPDHLRPATRSLVVPGTKTATSRATVTVDPALWPVVVAAVPAPLGYRWLRLHWKAALKAAGAEPSLRLHDLRHAHGQWAVDAGVPEARVQRSLRHSTAAMTRRYTTTADTGAVSSALATALAGAVEAASGE